MMEKIKILIVDDHPMMRKGLANSIEVMSRLHLIGEAQNGDEAIQLARSLQPDVILMDLIMPDKDGIEATSEIMEIQPNSRILVFSSAIDDEKIFAAIEAGASGYILKDVFPETLLQAIESVHRGVPYFSPSISTRVLEGIRTRTQKKKASLNFEEKLSPRELEVVKLLALGMTNKEISENLIISEGTVRSHVCNILDKLNLDNRSQVVLYAIKLGIVNV
jgi:NarL family two-component system response regulator LiaR